MKLNLHNKENKQIGDIDISDDVFLSEPSVHLVHEMVLLQHTRKVRTASTKTKSEVRGGELNLGNKKELDEPEQVQFVHHCGEGAVLYLDQNLN